MAHDRYELESWENDGGAVPPLTDADAPKVDHSPGPGWMDELLALIVEEDEQHSEPEYKPVTLEAHGLVFGDRGADYGHPLDDFSRTGEFWTTWLGDKLRPGAAVVAEDVGPMMVLFKTSRQRNRPKRDNTVDTAGYAETTERVHIERARRARVASRQEDHFRWVMKRFAAGTFSLERARAELGLENGDASPL